MNVIDGESFCGCCGREVRDDLLWCHDCLSHLLPYQDEFDHYVPLWDRTWFFQYGTECPFTHDCIVCRPNTTPPHEGPGTPVPLGIGTRHRPECTLIPHLSDEAKGRLQDQLAEIARAHRRAQASAHQYVIGGLHPRDSDVSGRSERGG